MPRRSGGGMRASAPRRGLRTASPPPRPAPRAPPRAAPPAPMPQTAPAPMGGAQPRQPGMFAQMATTAAGVAVGSTVGHMAAGALMGGGSRGGNDQPAEAAPAQPVEQQQAYGAPQQQQVSPCENELKQFINCAQTQNDLGLCQGFNMALRECRISYGLPLE
ncbi:hypothetical protein LSAT2_005725 [Lamellibrachia satsuma]|nr:hypothetical protein LSAT2_005725 [Lamellibrachia satsuma]